MDKIAKFLSKLNQKEQIVIFELLNQIILNEWKKLDYKKMIGYDNLFRVKKGKMRIVFRVVGSEVVVINIDYMGSMYKDLYSIE